MAGLHKPCDVGSKVRPPKMIYYLSASHKVSMMSSFVVGGDKNCRVFIWSNY